jgi:hypothetical protein
MSEVDKTIDPVRAMRAAFEALEEAQKKVKSLNKNNWCGVSHESIRKFGNLPQASKPLAALIASTQAGGPWFGWLDMYHEQRAYWRMMATLSDTDEHLAELRAMPVRSMRIPLVMNAR